MKHRALAAAICTLTVASSARAQSLSPDPTTVLAPLAGPMAEPAPGQENIGFYGTDLGFTFSHDGQLRILFGDTWADGNATPIGPLGEDCQGLICLRSGGDCPPGALSFPNGDAVESYVASQPPGAGDTSWQRQGPAVHLRRNAFGMVAPLPVYDGGPGSALLNMGPGRTPVAAFSSGPSSQGGAAFGIFHRSVSTQCSGGFVPGCPDDLVCDTSMGSYLGASGDEAIPCLLGTPLCWPIPSGGFCVDDTNSFSEVGDDVARLHSVATQLRVGHADPVLHEVYYTRSWATRKFFNPTVRAVKDFDPQRPQGHGNLYALPDATHTGAEKLLLWGRPGFVGNNAAGRSDKLYFAYVELPRNVSGDDFEWEPQYYTHTDAVGVARFSPDQRAAAPLDLSGSPTPDTETVDVVDQMSVAFIPGLDRWMMTYGGDLSDLLVDLFSGGAGEGAVRTPSGAIMARFADNPWGPWSAPEPLLEAGNPEIDPPLPGSQFAASGILHHVGCNAADCAPFSPSLGDASHGFLYAPNLIPEWTEDRGGHVDVYWNVSTWNPYQVVLLKSRIEKP